jgi:type I restriction enzyme, S subunit
VTSFPCLKHIARLEYGEALAQEVRVEGDVPVFGSNGIAGAHNLPNTEGPAILVGRKGSFGKVTWTDTPGFCIDTAYYVDSRHTSCNLRWLYWALQTLGLDVHSEDTGVPGLSREKAYQAKVRTPSPGEQEGIASFLDKQTARIDALIAEKERLVEGLRTLLFSNSSQLMTRGLNANTVLKPTAYPELGELPSHWIVKRLKVLGDVRSGVAKGKDLGERATVLLPYLRVANVQDGYVDLTEVSEIAVPESEATRYLLRNGDVLMNEGGDNDKLGRGAVWQGQIEPCIHQNHVFAVRLRDTSLAEWVSRFTSTHAARTYFFLRSKQSTNLASINQSNVRELPVPMPPDEERAAILAELKRSAKATTELIDHAVAHVERLREYRSSLISAAVTGQLDINAFEAKEAA